MLADQPRFPQNAVPDSRLLPAFDPPQIRLGTDYHHELRFTYARLAPFRPTLGRRLTILVDPGIDAVITQTIGESQDPFLVRRAVMAVADEDNRCFLRHRAAVPAGMLVIFYTRSTRAFVELRE